MSFFSRIKTKIKGIDPFYEEVRTEQIGLYQHYFSKLINSIDIDTQTMWSQSKDYDKQQMAKDEEVIEKIVTVEAVHEGLYPAILQVMVNQYFFADVYQRELDKEKWVKRVLHRKDVDYFPSGWQVRTLLEKIT
jgi:hypothetical protein